MELGEFTVHRDVIGTLRHLHRSSGGSIEWVDEISDDRWTLLPTIGDHDRCVRALHEVNGQKLPPSIIDEPHRKAYAHVLPESRMLPWSFCYPPATFARRLKRFIDSIASRNLDPRHVEGPYTAFRELTRKFRSSRVDVKALETVLDSCPNELARRHLESLRPGKGGYVEPPRYDFFGTRTGRLTVESGPLVLTLPASMRGLFVPALKGGEVLQVDFVSLEPRLLLARSSPGKRIEGDIYENLRNDAFEGSVPRDVVKRAVISVLYGMSIDTLSSELDISHESARALIDKTRSLFRAREETERIVGSLSDGRITNLYGRRVESEGRQHLNSFVQSSAIDVAHMGFRELLARSEIPMRPMFLIHDALVLEVAHEHRARFEQDVARGYDCPELGVNFPWKAGPFAKGNVG